ncbi:MAG: tetratricopeptide repeat protein [Acidobacteriaceae bacterium]
MDAQQPIKPPSASAQASVADLPSLRALIDRGHSEDALRQLDTLAATQPEPAGVECLRGLALYAEGKLPQADAAFAAAVQQDGNNAEAAQMRGLTLFRLGKPADAIPLLERARTWASQTKYDPNYVLALCYMDTRRYDDARHALAQQYGFQPDSAPAYLLAARMLLRREYLPMAQEYASKAIVLDQHLPLAHLLLGELALAGEHLDIAIAEFEKERDLNPMYGGVYDRLGDAYTRSGEYAKAQQSLQQALLLEPNSTGPYILLGKVLLKRQDPASAASYLQRAEAMDSSNYMTHGLLGQAYRSMGRSEDAAREMRLAEQLQSASTPVLKNTP